MIKYFSILGSIRLEEAYLLTLLIPFGPGVETKPRSCLTGQPKKLKKRVFAPPPFVLVKAGDILAFIENKGLSLTSYGHLALFLLRPTVHSPLSPSRFPCEWRSEKKFGYFRETKKMPKAECSPPFEWWPRLVFYFLS